MQTKNLIIFFVLSLLIIGGWTMLQSWIVGPAKPKDQAAKKILDRGSERPEKSVPLSPKTKYDSQLTAAAIGQSAGGPLDHASRLLATELVARPPPPPLSKDTIQTTCLSAAAIAQAAGPLDYAGRVVATELVIHPPKKEAVAQKAPPGRTPELINLGDDSYFLNIILTSEGAGVRQVVLTRFQEANKDGLPDHKKLHLVPAEGDPSHLLFHYEKPDDTRPVDTLGKQVWKVVSKDVAPGADEQKVIFEAEVPGQDYIVTKTFTLKKGDYHIGLAIGVRPKPGTKPTNKFRYQLTGAHGLPIEGVWYTSIYRNALIGSVKGSKVVGRDLDDSRSIGHWNGGEPRPRTENQFRYAGVAVQYFASVVVVDNEQGPNTGAADQEYKDNFIDFVRATDEGPVPKDRPYLADINVRLRTEPLTVGSGAEQKYVLYNGPVKVRLLGDLSGDDKVDQALVDRYEETLGLKTLTDWHSPGTIGSIASSIGLTWAIIYFTNKMHWVLWFIHEYTLLPWGLCIITLTVLVRGMMFPISRKQAMNSVQMQEKMAKLAPEVKKLQEKYKDDYQGLNQARTELYMRHGINPLSTLGGCLLLFVQMPIFLGLYYCLQESIHFRLEPFLWIRNLAAPDMIWEWGTWIPLISEPASMGSPLYLGPFFNLLPIVAVALMIVQQKMMTPPPQDEQQEMQQKMMKYMMVVFGWMFYKVAAGLCLYFIASSLWGVCERKLLPKSKTAAAAAAGASPPTGGGTDKNRATMTPRGKRAQRARERSAPAANGGTIQKLRDWWQEVLDSAKKK